MPLNQKTWVFKGQTYLDGRPYVYERKGIYTTASTRAQARNNILYKISNGDKEKIYRIDIDEAGLEMFDEKEHNRQKKFERENPEAVQLSMFDMMK